MSRSDNPFILVEREDGLVTVTLNRPEQGNRITAPMFDFLADTLDDLARRDDSRVLVLKAAGKDFCLGREAPPPTSEKPPTAAAIRDQLAKVTRANTSLERFPGITIAVVQGRALGAGCSLAGRCDLTLAAENASFGFPEILAGMAPTIVMAYFCKRLPRKKAFEMVVTGREISAGEAERIGLVNRVVPPDRLDSEVAELSSHLLAHDATMLRACKQFLLQLDGTPGDVAAEFGINLLANLLSSR